MKDRHGFFQALKQLPIISNWLDNGLYIYRENNLTKIQNPLSIRFPMIFIFSTKKGKRATYKKCSIRFGDWSKKVILLFDDKVVSFYKHEDSEKWLSNMKKYIDDCNYPRCKYFEIDEQKRISICSRENGHTSYQNLDFLAKEILRYNKTMPKYLNHQYSKEICHRFSRFGIDNLVSYVQHGDAAKVNILSDDEGYRFIDFDTIDIFPAFFDFFRLLLGFGGGMKLFYDGFFDQELSAVLEPCDVALSVEQKDKYLAAFLTFKEEWSRRIPYQDIPEEYILTKKVLQTIVT